MPLMSRPHAALPCLLLLLVAALAASNLRAAKASFAPAAAPAFSGRATIPVGTEPKSIAAADFNGDGLEDIVAANRSSSNISVILATGAGTFGNAAHFVTRLDPYSLVVGDFNEDGKNDVVVANGSFDLGNISLHLGDGAGNLSAATTFNIGGSGHIFAVGDFNEDGNLDLAVTNGTFEGTDRDNVYILLGTGLGTFSGPTKFPAGPLPRRIAVGDFNEDGNSDLAVANVRFGANTVSILLGTGTGGFGAPTQFAVGSSPICVAVGDFNDDGHSDLATANTDSHNISILLGTGAGTFGAATNFTAGSSFPLSLLVADYDGDEDQDLAVGFNSSQFSLISVLPGTGAGAFASPATFNAESGPTELAGADFNDDGQPDIAAANAQANSVSVLLSPAVKASVNDVTVTEGTGGAVEANFTVTLSAASTLPVVVGMSVEGVTADSNDFTPPQNNLTIPAGSLSGTMTVQITGDDAFEPEETFRVVLRSLRNALPGDAEGTGTIVDDDTAPSISVNDLFIIEGDGGTTNATFTVNLSNASYQTVTADFATTDGTAVAGSDYAAQAGTVTVNPGETTKTFTVLVLGDTVVEGNEDFFVNLSNPSNATIADAQARGTIVNDDPKVRFDISNATVTEGVDRSVVATLTRTGDLSGVTTVNYETIGTTASPRSDFTAAVGTLTFAPNETTKSITVLITDDAFAESNENFFIQLTSATGGGLGPPFAVFVTIQSNDSTNGPSPVKEASFNTEFFVRQHYADFLNREPDAAGLQFWMNEIESCGADQQCREVKRINVSAAFFLSIEFQETGYLVYRMYKAAFGNLPGRPVPLRLRDFLAGARRIGEGVRVGVGDWAQQLENNKNAFANAFVARADFAARHPETLTPAEFVDALNANAGGALSQAERDALVADLASGEKTRAEVLRAVAEDQTLKDAEFNKAFVLAQYFGYLRRNPDDSPDFSFGGYNFWLSKLNEFNGNFIDAEMVKAFITSIEYQQRFGL